jgi:hypothetical protein
LAKYITYQFLELIKGMNLERFSKIRIKVFEDTGKCGIFKYKLNKINKNE